MKDTKFTSIGYAQAIGIIAVVLGHYPIKPLDVFQPYVFHMPLFYFIGGMLFKRKDIIDTTKSVFRKHLFYTAYTYIIISIIAILLHSTIGANVGRLYVNGPIDSLINIISSNFHNNYYFLVGWFLFSYALVSLACRVMLAVNNKPFLLAVSIAIGYFGMTYIADLYHLTKSQSYNLLSQIMVGSMYYILGYLIRDFTLSLKSPYIPAFALLVLFTMKSYGTLIGLGMSWSNYPNGFISHATSSILCILTIFSISNILAGMSTEFKLLSHIGRESKVIMSYHMLAFTLVDFIFYMTGNFDISKTSALSHFKTDHYWYIYALTGVFIPLLLAYITNAARLKINPAK